MARHRTLGFEVFKSDGTRRGTRVLKDVRPGYNSRRYQGLPTGLVDFNGRLVFTHGDRVHGREPWISDGTESGTVLLEDINPSGRSDALFCRDAVVGDTLFFTADDGLHGRELWKTDGTEAGTEMVEDLDFGSLWNLVVAGGQLFFTAEADQVTRL